MLLEKEGLVEIPPRRRPRVSHVSLEEVEELYQIRVALNGLMIASFVRNADDEHMIQMNPLHEQIRRHAHVDDDAFQLSRRVLHNHWLNTCGNGTVRERRSPWKVRVGSGG